MEFRAEADRDVIADPNPGCPIDETCFRELQRVGHVSDLTKALKELEKSLAAMRRTYNR